jgi:hypothetical protein
MSDKTKSPGKFDELLGRISKLEEQIRSQQRAQLSDDQARELEKRIAALESTTGSQHPHDHPHDDSGGAARGLRHCALPPVPPRVFGSDVSPDRVRLIQMVSRKWLNGTKLRYAFMPENSRIGGPAQKALVREGFARWRHRHLFRGGFRHKRG